MRLAIIRTLALGSVVLASSVDVWYHYAILKLGGILETEALYRIDGLKWRISGTSAYPYCPTHNLKMYPVPRYNSRARLLECADCSDRHYIHRPYNEEQQYVLDKLSAKHVARLQTVNIDDEAVPLAKAEIKSGANNPYWIKARIVESKSGRRMIVYAGKQGKTGKSQIFIDPDVKRVGFDHSDVHPTEIFAKLEATFDDGSKSSMSK